MGLFLVLRKSVGKLTAPPALSKKFLRAAKPQWSRAGEGGFRRVHHSFRAVKRRANATLAGDNASCYSRYIGSSSVPRFRRATKKIMRPKTSTRMPIPIPTVSGVNGPSYFGSGVGVG